MSTNGTCYSRISPAFLKSHKGLSIFGNALFREQRFATKQIREMNSNFPEIIWLIPHTLAKKLLSRTKVLQRKNSFADPKMRETNTCGVNTRCFGSDSRHTTIIRSRGKTFP